MASSALISDTDQWKALQAGKAGSLFFIFQWSASPSLHRFLRPGAERRGEGPGAAQTLIPPLPLSGKWRGEEKAAGTRRRRRGTRCGRCGAGGRCGSCSSPPSPGRCSSSSPSPSTSGPAPPPSPSSQLCARTTTKFSTRRTRWASHQNQSTAARYLSRMIRTLT